MKKFATEIKLIVSELEKAWVNNKFIQAGILSKVYTECGFMPKTELGYGNTSVASIRRTFGNKVKAISDQDIDLIKKDDIKFFNLVYGGRYGNAADEGFKYRGRGFNQLTFKNNYVIYDEFVPADIVSNPDLVNTTLVASIVAARFFANGLRVNGKIIDTPEKGAFVALQINAGWGTNVDTPFFKELLGKQVSVVNELYEFIK